MTENQDGISGSKNVRKQTSFLNFITDFYGRLCCWIVYSMLIIGPSFVLYMCFTPSLHIFAMMYFIWRCYDRETLHNGGRRLKWLAKHPIWRCQRDYFPVRLIKTAELPPNTTYLFAAFPHGILSFGVTTNFLSDVNHFQDLFPGLTPYIHMHHNVLCLPVVREILLSFGLNSASPKSMQHVLNGPAGNISIVTVGGFMEMMKSIPGTNRLVLKNRKGFIRMALKSGSPLVPVYTFNETDTYDQIHFDWYARFLNKLNSTFRLLGVILMAKGPRKPSHLFGFKPYQTPLTTVVGSPIQLPKVENPSSELVDKYHEIFVQELTALFHKYKAQYDSRGDKATLSIE